MTEIWIEVMFNDAPTGRFISNFGNMIDSSGVPCRLYDNGAGYMAYMVARHTNSNGKLQPKLEYAHRLVAKYFIPNPFNLPQVNHKDCDKSNNHIDNLEWISRRANIDHAHAAGRMQKRYDVGAVKVLTIAEVIECYTRVRLNGEGVAVVARSMGKPRTTISSILNKRSRVDITDKLDEEFADKRMAA